MKNTIFVGDVHARPEIVRSVASFAKSGDQIIFLGDLLDGPGGAEGSAECVRLVREMGYECVLGNHELYPVFARSPDELAKFWGDEPGSETATRIWQEWKEVEKLLTSDDIEWLRTRPLYVQGPGWIAVHAKLPPGELPPQYVNGTPTAEQIALVDHTEAKPFWADVYDGRHGHCFYGHTRLSRRGGIVYSNNATLLDWDAKKGGNSGVCILGNAPVTLL